MKPKLRYQDWRRRGGPAQAHREDAAVKIKAVADAAHAKCVAELRAIADETESRAKRVAEAAREALALVELAASKRELAVEAIAIAQGSVAKADEALSVAERAKTASDLAEQIADGATANATQAKLKSQSTDIRVESVMRRIDSLTPIAAHAKVRADAAFADAAKALADLAKIGVHVVNVGFNGAKLVVTLSNGDVREHSMPGSSKFGRGAVWTNAGLTEDRVLELIEDNMTLDSGETEHTHAVATVTASGDTDVLTPTAGKRLKIYWVIAVSDPDSSDSPLIKVKVGSTEKYRAYAISKRQLMLGAADEKVTVNLSAAGSVAVTIIYDEVDG